jgi:peptide/nickel transport system permease protein
MFNYLIRRILYSVPVLLGVILLTFLLSFVVQSPHSRALKVLGQRATPQSVSAWLHKRGYDKPRFINTSGAGKWYDSQFCQHVRKLATFELGVSDKDGRSLRQVFLKGAVPSLLITVPALIAGLCFSVSIALYQVFIRNSKLDVFGALLAVALMSVPSMVYIVFGQAVLGLVLNYFPVYGFDLAGWGSVRYLLLPVCLMVLMHLGGDVRLYRAVFLEEISQDYVRTAQAKGVSHVRLLFVHVLKNGMISLITLVVAHLPLLVMGSLLLENFFGIPGLGNTLVLAIQESDFATVFASVYLGSILYLAGLLLTDICYALVDPRIRLS